jgi:hypothetical protein
MPFENTQHGVFTILNSWQIFFDKIKWDGIKISNTYFFFLNLLSWFLYFRILESPRVYFTGNIVRLLCTVVCLYRSQLKVKTKKVAGLLNERNLGKFEGVEEAVSFDWALSMVNHRSQSHPLTHSSVYLS